MEKDGQFDWILSYDDIKQYFSAEFTGVDLNVDNTKILVIGCGTSPMSGQMAQNFQKSEVISIDNDEDVITHMKRECRMERTKWYTYDIIEDCGIPQENELDRNGYFDLIVDKGTFDAILVEGATCRMLADVHRLLRIGGAYVLMSINSEELLTAIFGLPELQLDVHYYEDKKNDCSILLCKKKSDNVVDMESLAEREHAILDVYFKSDHPLVTPEFEEVLRRSFDYHSRLNNSIGAHGGFIPVQDAYFIMFVEHNAHLNYTYDLFEEDLERASLTHTGRMSAEEAVQFLKDVQ